MKRIEVIKNIMDKVKGELIITSTGMISREVYFTKDRLQNFYVTGSMGSSLGIGIGLALNTDKNVIVIAGDGDLLMSLGTMVLMNKLKLRNLKLIILDNNCYSSTGCQKTCSDAVDFNKIANCEVYKVEPEKGDVGRIDLDYHKLTKRFYNAINNV